MTPEELFAEYCFQCTLQGREPDRSGLCTRHPEHAEELDRLFDAWFERFGTGEKRSGHPAPSTSASGSAMASRTLQELMASLHPTGSKRSAEERYVFEREIARGGMGSVAQVIDTTLRRHLAMKRLLRSEGPEGSARTKVDRRLIERLAEEARLTGRLDHPGIVPVHELGSDEAGVPYFTMKLVRGETYAEILERHFAGDDEWSLVRCLEVLVKVCDTMAFAHAHGVLHRDLKPSNVMVGAFGEVYVMDWGLAKELRSRDEPPADTSRESHPAPAASAPRADEPSTDLTQVGEILGTPNDMPPEQAAGRIDQLGPPADVHAIGSMLYQLLTGRPPYSGREGTNTPIDVLHRLRDGEPERIVDREGMRTPLALRAICEKAMRRGPEDRYASAKELGADLHAFLEDRVVRAYVTGPWAELSTWIRRNRAFAMAIGLAVLAGLTSVILFGKTIARADAVVREELRAAARNAATAREEAGHAALRLEELVELSREDEIAALRQRADRDLWPLHPSRREMMRAWLEEARSLDVHRLALRRSLDVLEADLSPAPTAPAAPPWDSRGRLLRALATRRDRLAQGAEDGDERASRGMAALNQRIVQLRARIEPRDPRTLPAIDTLTAHERTWRWRQVQGLVDAFERFEKGPRSVEDVGLTMSQERSWDHPTGFLGSSVAEVERRLALLDRVEAVCSERVHQSGWRELEEAFVSGGNPLPFALPIFGLVPLGRDESSGLFEFWHVASGERPGPSRGEGTSRWVMEATTGMILVLLPGGRITTGAQSTDRDAGVHDPWLRPWEQGLQTAFLDPFLISKYEMTQGQWERLTRVNPSVHRRADAEGTATHPVEAVRRHECQELLQRLGLTLPTEVQWEYACRAGTGTTWFSGSVPSSLARVANLADRSIPPAQTRRVEPWNDGRIATAPVGSFAPNAFGLYDMLGNVSEWCLDELGSLAKPPRSGDGLRDWPGLESPLTRGGNYRSLSSEARVAAREHRPGTSGHAADIGVRPVLVPPRP